MLNQVFPHGVEGGEIMTYAREHRRAVRRIKEKTKQRETLKKWEEKRLRDDASDSDRLHKK
jgi:hypothetical protein